MDTFRHYCGSFSHDTAPRRRMFAAITGSKDGLAAHELALEGRVQDMTARGFIRALLKHELIVALVGRPERFKWKLYHQLIEVDLKPEQKRPKRITISWKEAPEAPGGLARTVRFTLEGIPDNGTLKVTGVR